MKNLFDIVEATEIINRINQLTPTTKNLWGKMNVSQMLAHCTVTYEMVYTDKYPKPNSFKIFLLKTFVKKAVVSDKPYPKNGRTAPQFLITNTIEFEESKKKLVEYIKKTQTLGESHFDNKESHSFGKLTTQEWNNLFYKHLNHHLTQFGV
ncbi:DUF1569 domain-containing protein [Flavobacterium frigoris]|uniref:DUF1569 domain-containing protein n=1 Tax=Flavobacterium frigoris TaxID=229204 RepID=A0A1H9JAC6_FLAFI|nr:DUF1569 domain-containing protein [Flavobacterium frigoris]SEQ83738.1 Protein of unknown function [Flavobacterium frigoris]